MQWGPKWGHYSLGPFPAGDLRELVSVCDVKVGSFGKGPEVKALLGKVGRQWLFFFMSLFYLSSRICWAPTWEHYGRKV
jgi:hypothetical protein